MKKVFLLLLIVCLSLVFVACSQEQAEDDGGDDGGEKDQLLSLKTEGQARLIDQGSSPKTVDHTGFRFQLTMTAPGATEESEIVSRYDIGGIDDVFWFKAITTDVDEDGDVDFDDFDAGGCIVFKEKGSNSQRAVLLPGQDEVSWSEDDLTINELFAEMVDAFLYLGHEFCEDGVLTRGEDDSIDGRPCSTYSLDIPSYLNYSNVSLKVWIDEEYGYTRKLEYDDKMGNIFDYSLAPVLKEATKPAALVALGLWN